MRTIGDVLDESRGLGKGFDFLRVFLAFSVLTWHCWPISAGFTPQYNAHFFWFFDYWILFVFFALSGFLITGSAQRLKLSDFLINRSLRIFPALTVEIVLAVLLIGPVFTSLPIPTYFRQPLTYHYLTNMVGVMNYQLPGVFKHNNQDLVNGSLWTVPYELGCYAMMSGLIYFGLLKRAWSSLGIAALVLVVGLVMLAVHSRWQPSGILAEILNPLFYDFHSRLFVAFPLGIAAYLYRHKIPYSWPLFSLVMVYLVVFAALGHRSYYPVPIINLISALPLTYALAFLGVTKLPVLPFFHRGDYSYGIYLYGWPMEQIILASAPWMKDHVVVLWLLTCILTTAFAAFSWHVIEKPVLRLRKKFSFVARQRLAEAAPEARLAGSEHDQPIIGQATPGG